MDDDPCASPRTAPTEEPTNQLGRRPFAPRGFQFTLAGVFYVVTGVATALSLIAWEPSRGSLAAVLIVGTGWAIVARRAGHRRVAYYLAAAALGAAGAIVFVAPFAGFGDGFFGITKKFSDSFFCLLMSASTVVTAGILRGRIRDPSSSWLPSCLLGVYVTALVFGQLFVLSLVTADLLGLRGRYSSLNEVGFTLCVEPILAVFASAIIATVMMPLMGPTALLFRAILQRIDPPPLSRIVDTPAKGTSPFAGEARSG